MAPKGGISGLAVAVAAAGGFLVYAGIKDVPLIEGLREIIGGRVPAGREQKRNANFVQGFLRPIGGSDGVSGTSVPTDYALGAVQPHVRLAASEIGSTFGLKTIGGYRPSDLDHGRGLALDLMIDNAGGKPKGDQVAAYLLAHRARLGLTYIIWNMRIASASKQNWAWRPYKPITSAGDFRHEKHVHASFKAVHTYQPRSTGSAIKAV